jgi:hypothetical protein
MNILDSLKKYQKTIVLGVALAVITLYMIPIDQLVNAVSGNGNTKTPPNSSNDKVKG